MPEYFWIILFLIISLLVGFTAGLLLSRKETINAIKRFQDEFEKVIQKLESLEKLVPASDRVAQIKNKSFNQTSSPDHQFRNDILAVAKRIEKITNTLKIKPRSVELKTVKEDEPKVTVGNRIEDEGIVSNKASNSFEQPPFSYADESENYSFNPRYDYQEPSAQIIHFYNRGVDNHPDRDLFREKYAMIRLGNSKAVELRLGEVIEPEFRELDNGNFLAVPSPNGLFYVLPRFDTTLNSSAYNEGGFGYVFDCPNYNPDMAYTVVRVKRPAVFRRDGNTWTLIEKGELTLQQ